MALGSSSIPFRRIAQVFFEISEFAGLHRRSAEIMALPRAINGRRDSKFIFPFPYRLRLANRSANDETLHDKKDCEQNKCLNGHDEMKLLEPTIGARCVVTFIILTSYGSNNFGKHL